MKLHTVIFYSLLASLLVLISGCASSIKPEQSGFLKDYSQLKPAKDYENTHVFLADGLNKNKLATLKKIKLVPFEIWLNQLTKDEKLSLNSFKIRELSNYFHQQLTQKLTPHFQIVDVATDDTLIIQGAFSNIKVSEPDLSVTDFIPVRIVLNSGNAVYLSMTNQQNLVSEVSIEVEFLSGKNNKRLFAMTALKQMDLTVAKENGNVKAVKVVLDTWVENFVAKLTQLKTI